MRHDNRAALVTIVTGAGSGLGAATAHVFARAGHAVACLDVRGDPARQTCDSLPTPPEHIALACDVADERAVADAVAGVVERYGRLDVVVSCAGVDHTLPAATMTVPQWDQVVDVNMRAPFLFARAAWPVMERQQSGHLVNVASTAALRAWANASAYHASKAGLVNLGRALGVEGRPHNIRVTTIIPGGMRTAFFDRFVEQGIPMPDERNLQDPANVAQAILFAVELPPSSVVQELVITPRTETSWP